MIIVKSKIREVSDEYKVSKEFIKSLDEKTRILVEEAKKRAKLNGRTTLMKQDL